MDETVTVQLSIDDARLIAELLKRLTWGDICARTENVEIARQTVGALMEVKWALKDAKVPVR